MDKPIDWEMSGYPNRDARAPQARRDRMATASAALRDHIQIDFSIVAWWHGGCASMVRTAVRCGCENARARSREAK